MLVKRYSCLFILFFLLFLIYSCEKEEKKVRPSVTSSPVTNITTHSALTGGKIKDDGGASILSCGVVWDTIPNPDINKFLTNDSLIEGSFTSEVKGLQSGTKYYIRAYAINSAGTSYGEELDFLTLSENKPVVKTLVARYITKTSAIAGGEIPDSGMQMIINKGICWQTYANPSVDDYLTDEGPGSKDYLSKLTGLTPGTTYYYRAYASNNSGTGYGDVKSFTTPTVGVPIVKTVEVSSVTYTSAVSGGEIPDTGDINVQAKGVCWNISPNPTVNDYLTNDGQGPDAFISVLSGLSPGTIYYYRAYATNSIGSAYGEEMSFQTLIIPTPDIITDDATNITATSATCSGSASSDTNNAIQTKGICYASTSNPSINDFITDEGYGSGSFSSQLTGLLPGTTYFIRAYAVTAYGTYYGNEKSFITNDTLPEVETLEVTVIKANCAVVTGSVLSDGSDSVTTRGICWSLSTGPTMSDQLTSSGSGKGSFTGTLTGLDPATSYYVRSFATNSIGTVYGNELTFITKDSADWILTFSDDFENYETGSYPPENWVTRFTGSDAEISEDVAYEGNKSFMLSSMSTWARVEAIPLDSVPDFIIYEGAVYINQANKGYAIGFGFKENSTTYRSRNAVIFGNDGKIYFGTEIQDWLPQVWYYIKVECDFTLMKGKLWIDGALVATDVDLSNKDEIKDFMIMGNNFSGAVSKAYYDNIKIFIKDPSDLTCQE